MLPVRSIVATADDETELEALTLELLPIEDEVDWEIVLDVAEAMKLLVELLFVLSLTDELVVEEPTVLLEAERLTYTMLVSVGPLTSLSSVLTTVVVCRA